GVELRLAAEVMEEGGLPESDAFGHLGEPDAGKAAPGEEALRAVEDLVAGRLPELRHLRRHRPSVRYRIPDRSVESQDRSRRTPESLHAGAAARGPRDPAGASPPGREPSPG